MTARCHRWLVSGCILLASVAFGPSSAFAHCDTLDGPVVKDARVALEKRTIEPTLKWVHADKERELRAAFEHAIAVRTLGPAARELADRSFFETLVRLHREGEGAPYTGLKPSGTQVDPVIAASDEALATESIEALARMVAAEVERGVRQRFERALAARRHAGDSVEQGREFVAAYVELTHYVERVGRDASDSAARHAPSPGSEAHRH